MTEPVSQLQRKASYSSSLDTLLTSQTLEELPNMIQPVVFTGLKFSIDEELWKKGKAIAKFSQKVLKDILDTCRKQGKPKAKTLLASSLKRNQLLPFHAALANATLQREKKHE